MVDIAFITDEPGSNGFARKARGLAAAFKERGVRFDAVYLKGLGAARADATTRELELGAPRAALATPAIARYLRGARPRLALVNSGQLGPAAVAAGLIARRPVVPWEPAFLDRDLPSLPPRMRVMNAAQNVLYRRAPAVVAPSRAMVEWVARHRGVPRERVHLVPNPIDGDAVRRAAGARPASDGVFRLCAVGRLVEQKGYDVLVEALALVRDELPRPWRLTVIGEAGIWRGSWEERLRALVERHGLADNVRLAGYLDNPHAEMARADLFVHAARWEPFGNVLVEALALGLPVVAADCPGGPAEILDSGRYGVLVPNEDPRALGRAIAELANDEARRAELAAAAPAAAERYAPGQIADRLLELARAPNF
ncbi:MAG TPA: glycosyltransferase [Solirubrobacterales bacterium]